MANLIEQAKLKADELLREAYASAAAKGILPEGAELKGNVKLFFQPDEEGDGGAARMIAAGCMENPSVDAVFACHIESDIPTGTVSVRSGPICAASNPFAITLRGVGTHGAKPHQGTDVIVAGSQIVTALQTISSRRTSPTEPVVVPSMPVLPEISCRKRQKLPVSCVPWAVRLAGE